MFRLGGQQPTPTQHIIRHPQGPTSLAGLNTACVKVSALLWLISLNAHEQFFFQPCPALIELLNCHLVTNFGLITLEKLDDVAVLVTKRVEAFIRRH
jgi:hypothetical protein